MTWNLRYQVKSYIRLALWIIPLFALLLEQVLGALAQALDTQLAWKGLEFGPTGAQALLNAITTLRLSFIVFTFASLLVAIQVASGQYTPRIIATTLFAEAEKAKGVIEFVPQVGDFVGSGEPLFLLHGAEAVQERKLLASVVFGAERTMDQDPLFAFRILVDIAIKALSKAINDPTTAVLAIESLYVLPEDLKLARIPDSQGLGGSSHTEAASDKLSA